MSDALLRHLERAGAGSPEIPADPSPAIREAYDADLATATRWYAESTLGDAFWALAGAAGTSLDGLDVYRQTCGNRHDDGCTCTGSVVESLDDMWAPCPTCAKRHRWNECYPDRDTRPVGILGKCEAHESASRRARDRFFSPVAPRGGR